MDLLLLIFLSVALLHYSRNNLIPSDHPWTPLANLILEQHSCMLAQWAGWLGSSCRCFPLLPNGLLIPASIPCPSRFSQGINTWLVSEAEMKQGRGRATLPLTNLRVLQGWHTRHTEGGRGPHNGERTTKRGETKATLKKSRQTHGGGKQTRLRHKPLMKQGSNPSRSVWQWCGERSQGLCPCF